MREIMGREGHESVLCVSHAGASIHFFMDCSDHENVIVDAMSNCMIYGYDYDGETFTATDFWIPDLSALEAPGLPPQVRRFPRIK
jgi:hypothetical protein